jgi:hypothetical protein
MKKIAIFLALLSLAQTLAFAQLSDNFADNDFSNNPTWTPNNGNNFTIVNNLLRSNSATANSSFYITTPSSLATSATWEFWVNLQFNTSGTNYVDVYLISQNQNLTQTGNNGYFVRIGGTPDEVSLYKITNGTASLLINGADGITNSTNNTLKIRVIRDPNSVWTLERGLGGNGTNFITEGTAIDNTHQTSNFFGVLIRQSTASFFNKHFLDDFVVAPLIIDTEPPTVNSFKLLNANQLQLDFSEKSDLTSAQNVLNYLVNNGVGNPNQAVLATSNQSTVILTFGAEFPSQVPCTLNIQNVKDLANNTMVEQNFDFTFIKSFSPIYNELIISEIMTDPRGAAQPLNPLPDAEYVEIYNRGNRILNLKDCKFSDASTSKVLPEFLLFPNEYVILCDISQVADFQSFGKVIGLNSFPGLTNSGELLTLRNHQNELLFAVQYADNQYQNNSKKDGGWSLEMIDVTNPCLENDNWLASEAARGGTPGKLNSVNAARPDAKLPQILSVIAAENQAIEVKFDKKMHQAEMLDWTKYQINPSITIQSIEILDTLFFKKIQLKLSQPLQTQTVYQLIINNLADCSGNIIAPNSSFNFGLAEQGDSLEVILNEILFNPRTAGSDFVELYNNSNQYINLKDWKIANLADGIIANQTIISQENLVIAPKQYLVLTENLPHLQSEYPRLLNKTKPFNFLIMNSLPSFLDNEGTVFLINNQNQVLERFDYKDDFHYPLLADKEGVSLERIAFQLPTNNRNTWQSAASTEGFATPGYLNSQNLAQGTNNEININPPVFTPDGDGNQDFTAIELRFNQSANNLNINIFDYEGREIKTLAVNQSIGTSPANFIWDGTTNQGQRARMGYYLILVKVLDTNGKTKVYKEKVVVGTRF